MPAPPRTELYVCVTVEGDVEEARERLARGLEYLASEARRPGWSGGEYGGEEGGPVVSADLVTPAMMAEWRAR